MISPFPSTAVLGDVTTTTVPTYACLPVNPLYAVLSQALSHQVIPDVYIETNTESDGDTDTRRHRVIFSTVDGTSAGCEALASPGQMMHALVFTPPKSLSPDEVILYALGAEVEETMLARIEAMINGVLTEWSLYYQHAGGDGRGSFMHAARLGMSLATSLPFVWQGSPPRTPDRG